jgi:hypothetical protein
MSLSHNQLRAIAALLTCRTRNEAAEQAGISPRTLRAYFEDAEFSEAYRKAFAGLLEDADRQAKRMLSPALDALEDIMKDAEISPAARVSAARAALEYGLRFHEIIELDLRLEALEREYKEE